MSRRRRSDNDESTEVTTTETTMDLIHNESWVKSRWRPLIAWQYFCVCVFDFIVGPVITMAFFHQTGGEYVQWTPLTIQGGGLYHLAMGAILGITSWSRMQEKLHRVESYD